MVKIRLPSDINTWYLKELGLFFKKSKKHNYKDIAKIVKKSLGLSYKQLLVAEPSELERIANSIKDTEPSNFTSDKEKLINLYTSFRESVSSKNYIKKLNLRVCPYCNRNFIFNFKRKDKEEATAQLDHFFDKSKYPYLSLSLYNLIPSCSICNQRKSKHDVLDKPIFNPFEENIHNYISFESSKILSRDELSKQDLDFFCEDRISITTKYDTTNNKIKEHLEIFNIERLYNNHKDIVADLYKKRVIYSDDYIDELLTEYNSIFKSREELISLITCGYINDEDLHKRPLSKLIKDISQELGLY